MDPFFRFHKQCTCVEKEAGSGRLKCQHHFFAVDRTYFGKKYLKLKVSLVEIKD